MKQTLFIDTWGWLVLANPKETEHPAANQFYHQEKAAGSRIMTTDYVLDEVITFLFVKTPASLATEYMKGIFASIDAGFVRLENVGPMRFEKAWKMRLKYQDQPKISFTDFTSFIVMQELQINRVLTNDHHFEQVNLGFERVP